MTLIKSNNIYRYQEDPDDRWYKRISQVRLILFSCLIGNIAFLADLLIPTPPRPAFVMSEKEYTIVHSGGIRRISNGVYLYTTLGKARISENELLIFKDHDLVYIRKSPINGIIREVRSFKNGHWFSIKSIVNLFFPFVFFPMIGLLASIGGLFAKKLLKDEQSLDFKFSIMAVIFFILTCFIFALT